MTTNASVALSRTTLSLPPLLITDDGTDTYTLTQAGLGRPIVTTRYTYADSSPDVESSLLLQAVRDISSLPLSVLVQADSSAALDDALEELAEATWQFTYTATVTVGGVTKVWRCQPTVPQADAVMLHARADQHLEVVNLTIPVDPTPGG